MIEITTRSEGDPMAFDVAVSGGDGRTEHRVTMDRPTFERLGGGAAEPSELIDAAFRFLLDREPKEAIMAQFDVRVIARYFPEFEAALPDYIEAG